MKKAIVNIILGVSILLINVIVTLYPTGRLYVKHYVCHTDAKPLVSFVKTTSESSLFDEIKEESFFKLKEFQTELCNQYKIEK